MDEEETRKHCLLLTNRLITAFPDHIANPKTIEEEAHNVQALIDAISLDLLSISLSHITGEDVVSKNVYAVYNLLEIFEGILLYMSDIPESASSLFEEHHTCGNEAQHLPVYHDKGAGISKSNDDFVLRTDEDQSRTNLSRRLSKSLEEVYIPSDDLGISEKVHKASSDRSRQIKRKTRKLPGKVNNIKLKAPSFNQIQEVSGKKQSEGLFRRWKSKSTSLDNISTVSFHPVVGEENDREVSVSSSSEKEKPEGDLLEHEENVISEPQLLTQPLQITRETVDEQYARNLETKLGMYFVENEKQRRIAKQMEKTFLKTVKPPVQKKISSVYKKSYISASHRKGKYVKGSKGLRTASSSQLSRRTKESPARAEQETGYLQELREEFPFMQLTPSTVRRMKQKYEKQLRIMHKNVAEALHRKPRTQLQVEAAAKRQAILSDILRKETKQEQYKKELNEHREFQTQVKATYREVRQQSSRVRNYYDEFHNQMKRRLQQRNSREEVLLKHVFEKGVDIQKEQVRELLQHVKERQEKDAADQKLYLDALENFYQTQLSLVTESLAVERRDLHERLKSQKKVINSLKRDQQHQLKQEVRKLQNDIVSDKDAFHFRELDAELCVEKLRDKYSIHFARPR